MGLAERHYMTTSDDFPQTPLPPITSHDVGYTLHDTCWRCEATGVTLVPDPMVRDGIGVCGSCAGKRHRVKEIYFSLLKRIKKGLPSPPPYNNENNPPV